MAAPGQNPDSPSRRGYGNPVGNNSSQMGNQLGSQVGDPTVQMTDGRGEMNEGYNTRVKRLSPDQRAKLQESIQNNYTPLEPLPSKAVQRQRAHQAQARAEAEAASRFSHRSPAPAPPPAREYRSPPRAGLPSGAPSKDNPTPGSPRAGGVEFMQAVQERAMAVPTQGHFDICVHPGASFLAVGTTRASPKLGASFEPEWPARYCGGIWR